jgi:hypothetical protein
MFLFVALLLGFYACKEQQRFEIGYDDTVPPTAPVYISYKPLYGGARIYYEIPPDEDVLSIDASYINTKGKEVWFSVSYFQDSLDVYGFNDSLEHVVQLYATDRAGNKSEKIAVPVIPLEPALSRVEKSMIVRGGFSSFYLDWRNELRQNINVYVDFNYTRQGQYTEHKLIYTSTDTVVRWFIRDLDLTSQEPVNLKVRVEDPYGNITDYIDKGQIVLLEDEEIPKEKWILPEANDSINGVPMAFLESEDAMSKWKVIDGIVDIEGLNLNYISTGSRGRTGFAKDGNLPWNIMIDLGEEYELSRVVTHQRHRTATGTGFEVKGMYYMDSNVGLYNMYISNEDETGVITWDSISRHKIDFPVGLTEMEYKQLGMAGDMAYFYPDDPQFTKPTRWFRYEALFGFSSNYTSTNAISLSEITLYAKKKAK